MITYHLLAPRFHAIHRDSHAFIVPDSTFLARKALMGTDFQVTVLSSDFKLEDS